MADRIWRGRAAAIAQVDTITVAGTWVAGELITLTINDKDLVITVGTEITVAEITEIIRAAWNGDALEGSESRNTTGNLIAEFDEITATDDDASVVTLTADTAGRPFTQTSATNSALGTLTPATTAGQGPNDISIAENWSGNAVPVNGDVIFFQESDSPALYELNTLAAVTGIINVLQSYTGTIGLPRENVDATAYVEYRDRFLQTSAATITIGEGPGTGSGRIQIDSKIAAVTIDVLNTGAAIEADTPAFLWIGTPAFTQATINARGGSVGLARDAGDVADVLTLEIDAGTVTGFDGTLLAAITIANGGALTHSGTFGVSPAITIRGGGIVTYTGNGAIPTVNVEDGTYVHDSTGTITTLTIDGAGVVDFANRTDGVTVTNATMSAGASYTDTNGRVTATNGILLSGTTLDDVEIIDGKTGRTITIS